MVSVALGMAACYGPKPVASAETEARLKKLEDYLAKNRDAIEFLAKVYAQQAHAEDDEPADDVVFGVAIADDVRAGQVEGPAGAAVTIIKAFDFACPHCANASSLMTELVSEYGGKLRVVYKNMVVHESAMPAHLASCAAARQGKYLAFKEAFWDKGFGPYAASGGKDQSSLAEDNLLAIAKGVGLDPVKLKVDMASAECAARLEHDLAELLKFHVDSTPMFFINGRPIAGAIPKADLEQIIDEQLKIAEASGIPGADYYQKVVLGKGEKAFRAKATPKH